MQRGRGVTIFQYYSFPKGSRKKQFFFYCLTPPLSSLVAPFFGGIFLELKKSSFFFVAGPLKKNFVAASPIGLKMNGLRGGGGFMAVSVHTTHPIMKDVVMVATLAGSSDHDAYVCRIRCLFLKESIQNL